MKIIFTKESLDWINENRLYSYPRKGINHLRIGGSVEFIDNLSVEPYTGFYPFTKIISAGSFSYSHSMNGHPLNFKMGRYCSIAGNVSHRGYNHPSNLLSTSPFAYDADESIIDGFIQDFDSEYTNIHHTQQLTTASIQNDVWIGDGVHLYPGITISTGAIIATKSVLTKSVGAYEIWGGNPAKFIKKRFDDATITLLIESEWWNYKFTDFKGLPINSPHDFASQFTATKDAFEKYTPRLINLNEMPGERI